MPKATGSSETEQHDLKTCPGGYVVLRRMTYGEFIKRREMLSGMRMEGKGRDAQAVLQLANEQVTQFEFSRCIVDHNLEDDSGRKLNLGSPKDFSQLDTRIGQEIGELIDKMNQLHNEDEDGNPAGEVNEEGN